jgi:hypothetical protein
MKQRWGKGKGTENGQGREEGRKEAKKKSTRFLFVLISNHNNKQKCRENSFVLLCLPFLPFISFLF